MNNINEMIDKIYSNTINLVLNGFEDKYIELIKQKYYEKIRKKYLTLENKIKNYNASYEIFYQFEQSNWNKKTIEEKKSIFIDDINLNQIVDIASFSYESAKNRLINNIIISEQYANKLINKLKELDKNVLDFNKDLSNWYLSESIMDLSYACGKTDNTSLRIGHIR